VTRGNIIADLKKLIGPGIEVDDGGLSTWVNDAYMQLVGKITEANPDYFTKSATTSTVTNQQEYALPSDCEKVLMVNIQIDGTWKRVLPMPNINYVPTHADTTSSQGFSWASPSYYILGDNIGFEPIPDETTSSNIKLWYVYTPTELSADSDVPALPAKYHHILKYGAYANYLDQDDEHAAAERMRLRFDDLCDKAAEALSIRQVDEPKSIQITHGNDLWTDNEGYYV
jgi:hypothetical protein